MSCRRMKFVVHVREFAQMKIRLTFLSENLKQYVAVD